MTFPAEKRNIFIRTKTGFQSGMSKINCFVVDDNEIDRLTVLLFLETYPQYEITGVFESAEDTIEQAKTKPPDILFLDIDLPGMNGLRLREQLLQIPACVFITSFPHYALEGFEMNAIDFLVKPFTAKRFEHTMERLAGYFEIKQKAELLHHTLGAESIFVKNGSVQVKLQLHEIIYFEALNNYTNIVTKQRKYTVLSTLSNLLKEKSFKNFIRIHRSYAVQKHFIKKISAQEVEMGNIRLPIGRTYKDALDDLSQ